MSGDGDIQIKSKEGFNQTINSLDQTRGQVAEKSSTSESVTEAVTSASSNGQAGAPAFTETLKALSQVMGDVKKHVTAAQSSVNTAVGDMRTLVNGMTDIDDSGEQKVVTA